MRTVDVSWTKSNNRFIGVPEGHHVEDVLHFINNVCRSTMKIEF